MWDKEEKLGKKVVDETLQRLRDFTVKFERNRRVQVVSCRRCQNFDLAKRILKIEDSELPVAVLFPGHEQYAVTGRFRSNLTDVAEPLSHLVDFLKQYDAGHLQAWTLSQPRPSDEEQEGAIFEVVGSTFQEEVRNVNESVLLWVYAPWCGFCKKVQDPFQKVARAIAGNPFLRVVRLNWDKNMIPPPNHFHIHGVPAFFLLPQGKKDYPELFHEAGDLKSDDLMKWLRSKVEGLAEWLDKPREETTTIPESGFGDLETGEEF